MSWSDTMEAFRRDLDEIMRGDPPKECAPTCIQCGLVFRESRPLPALGERLQCSDCALPFVSQRNNSAPGGSRNYIKAGLQWRTIRRVVE